MDRKRRIVVVRAGALGDVLLLRTALASLRRGGFEVALLAPGRPARLLAAEVAEVWAWEGLDVARLLADEGLTESPLKTRLASVESALAVTRDIAVLTALRRCVETVEARDPFPPAGQSAAPWYAGGALALGGAAIGVPPPLALPAEGAAAAAAFASRLPPGFLALHPGSGSAAKNWATEGFCEVAEALCPGVAFALVAGPADRRALAAIAGALPRAVIVDSPLHVLACLLARAGLYVGNDSGVSHLAAAAGAPTLALFGPTDPLQWAPVGPRVRCLRAPDGELARLGPAAVVAAAETLRSEAPGPPAG